VVPLESARPRLQAWPHLVRKELLAAQAIVLVVLVLGILIDAPLGPAADLSNAPVELKAPWYFVSLQELLVYLEPWIVGGVLPILLLGGLVALPYLDRLGARGYGIRQRPIAHLVFASFALAWSALTIIGALLRGPSWAFLWPWQRWDPRLAASAPTRSLAEALGLPGHENAVGVIAIAAWCALLAAVWLVLRRKRWLGREDPVRSGAAMLLIAAFVGIGTKVLLHLAFHVGYLCHVRGFGF